MLTALVVFVVGLAVVVGAGLALAPAVASVTVRVTDRVRRSVAPLGRIGGPAAIGAVGSAVVLVLLWPVGELLASLESSVDVPVFDWMKERLGSSRLVPRAGDALPLRLQIRGWWPRLNQLYTGVANTSQIRITMVVAAVVLAWLWRRRAWWVPPLALGATYAAEYLGQKFLKQVVDRGHPPTTLGSYPSGGCARLICIWGVILLLVLLIRPAWSRRTRLACWLLLAVAAYTEGWTRTYLLKHWVTDVVGGWLYGTLVLAVAGTATVILARATLPGSGVPERR